MEEHAEFDQLCSVINSLNEKVATQSVLIQCLESQLRAEKEKSTKNGKAEEGVIPFDPVSSGEALALKMCHDSSKPGVSELILLPFITVVRLFNEVRALRPSLFTYYGIIINMYRTKIAECMKKEDFPPLHQQFIDFFTREKARLQPGFTVPFVVNESETPQFDPLECMKATVTKECGPFKLLFQLEPLLGSLFKEFTEHYFELLMMAPESILYYQHVLELYQDELIMAMSIDKRIALAKSFTLYLVNEKAKFSSK